MKDISESDGKISVLDSKGDTNIFDKCIIATGGKSYPPVNASTSITSPAKYIFLTILLSIVFGLISFVSIPPVCYYRLFYIPI